MNTSSVIAALFVDPAGTYAELDDVEMGTKPETPGCMVDRIEWLHILRASVGASSGMDRQPSRISFGWEKMADALPPL